MNNFSRRSRFLKLAVSFGAAALAQSAGAATPIVWTGAGANTFWNNPANWSPMVVPDNSGGVEYDVIIPPGTAIFVPTSVAVVYRVNSINLPAGSTLTMAMNSHIEVATETGLAGYINLLTPSSTFAARPASAGGSPGTLRANINTGAGSTYQSAATAAAFDTLGSGTLGVAGGAGVVNLASLLTLSVGTGTGAFGAERFTFQTAGSGRIDLSGLTSIALLNGARISLNSTGGGDINVSHLTGTGTGLDINGTVDLSALSALDGCTAGGGANLSSVTRVLNSVIGNLFGAQIGTLTEINGSSLGVQGGSYTGAALINSYASNGRSGYIFTVGNGSFDLSGLHHFEVSGAGAPTLQFEATNGQLNLSNVPAFERAAGFTSDFTVSLTANSGGTIVLDHLMQGPDRLTVLAAGGNLTLGMAALGTSDAAVRGQSFSATVNGVINLPALLHAGEGTDENTTLAVATGGVINLPQLLSLGSATTRTLTIDHGTINAPSLTSLRGENVTLTAGTFATPTLASMNGVKLFVLSASYTAPALTSAADVTGLLAQGAGSLLALPVLTTITQSTNSIVDITASAGTIDLSGLTAITRTQGSATMTLRAEDGGTILLPALITLASNVNLVAFNGQIDARALSSLGAAPSLSFNRSGAAAQFNLDHLATLGSGSGRAFAVGNGTWMLPSLSSLGTASNVQFTPAADGTFLLPALADVGGTADLRLQVNGVFTANALTTFGAAVRPRIILGAGAVLNMTGLLNLGTALDRDVTLAAGARFNAPSLVRLENTDLSLSALAQVVTGALQSLNGSTFLANGGAVFAPTLAPGVTYVTGELSTIEIVRAAGAGSRIDLNGLTTIRAGTITENRVFTVTAASGGVVTLNSFTGVESLNGARVTLNGSGGMIAVPALTDLHNITLVQGVGGVQTGALTSIDQSSITATAGTFTLPAGITSYSSTLRATAVLFSAENGATMDLSPLTALTLTAPTGGAVYTVRTVGTGSLLRLGNLVSVTVANGAQLAVNGAAGSTIDIGRVSISTALSMVGGARAQFNVTGDFGIVTNDETRSVLTAAIISARGSATTLEVGGANLGLTSTAASNQGNFGLGQLRIGDTIAGEIVRLIDASDNGNRAGVGGREVLYLFGVSALAGTSADGLVIAQGGTLDLGGLAAFARIGGTLVDLRTLFAAGQTSVVFDGGSLLIPGAGTGAAMVIGLMMAAPRRRLAASSN
ncbi:hypothetical protein BH11PLA1_BH11PLA1_01630 [soil metagenome]